MEIFQEWFVWGESDLAYFGVGILALFILLPWRENQRKQNGVFIAVTLVVYGICEGIVSYARPSWGVGYVLLFVGGVALAMALGRVVRMIWSWHP